MKNSVQYLTYEDYKELGGDSTLDNASFNLLEQKARKQIDHYTFNRLIDGVPANLKDEIDMTMFRLIGMNQSIDRNVNKSSESIDGYSVSYGGSTQANKEIGDTIKVMLSGLEVDGVPLLYAGGVNDNKHIYYNIP